MKEEYLFKKDTRTTEDLIEEFKQLDTLKRMDILIKWFGIRHLFKEMILKESGIKHLRESLK